MQDFRKLKVWERAQAACVRIYSVTAQYPREERFGLVFQLRRAAVSVGANISEGAKRLGKVDKTRFWNIAQSSAAEVISELDVAIRLGYRHADEASRLSQEYDEICAILAKLINQARE